jgi:hypothetical protein
MDAQIRRWMVWSLRQSPYAAKSNGSAIEGQGGGEAGGGDGSGANAPAVSCGVGGGPLDSAQAAARRKEARSAGRMVFRIRKGFG